MQLFYINLKHIVIVRRLGGGFRFWLILINLVVWDIYK